MSNPVWSPDGSKIYFTSDRTGQNEIWSMRIKDKVFDQVTRGGNIGSSRSLAAINNSGTLLAYIQKEADNSEFLKVVSLE
jgi:Tol biopolymer transport system component